MDVSQRLVEIAGGDPFDEVRLRCEAHQAEHGCGLYHAGPQVMHLVAAIARASGARRALDLGSGLGYSTLWIASALAPGGQITGIDGESGHIDLARSLAAAHAPAGVAVEYVAAQVADVLRGLAGPYDLIHDDAWFGRPPAHLEDAVRLLRPGGVLTMANWFLLVDAITGEPRNDWARWAGPTWPQDTMEYAHALVARGDLDLQWVTDPPMGFAVKRA